MPSGEDAAIVEFAATAAKTPFPYVAELHCADADIDLAVAVNAVTGVVTSAAKTGYEDAKYEAVALFNGKYPGADSA